MLQSLPAIPVAIAIVLYGLTLLPLSTDKMKAATALVEYVSCYEIRSDGRPVAWFRSFGDSLSPVAATVVADTEVIERRLITGVWINRYDFMPSCRGRILLPAVDTTAYNSLAAARRTPAKVIGQAIATTRKEIERLDLTAAKLQYYLDTHNVSDDGYNAMAAFNTDLNRRRKEAALLLTVLEKTTKKHTVSIRHIGKYNLLYNDGTGRTRRTACNDITTNRNRQFRIIQTADKGMPKGASALYFHRWTAPAVMPGNRVTTTSYYGSSQPGFSTDALKADLFFGIVTKRGGHDVPDMFAPDGSPVFTTGGRLVGITLRGKVVVAKSFKFGFNDLLQ